MTIQFARTRATRLSPQVRNTKSNPPSEIFSAEMSIRWFVFVSLSHMEIDVITLGTAQSLHLLPLHWPMKHKFGHNAASLRWGNL